MDKKRTEGNWDFLFRILCLTLFLLLIKTARQKELFEALREQHIYVRYFPGRKN